MVIFERVSKFVLRDIAFCVPKGGIVGVIGASGAGKTTLLRLACGLLAPAEGRVFTLRRDPVRDRRLLGSGMSVLFTGIPVLDENETVRQGYETLREIYRMEADAFERRYAGLGERLGFAPYAGAPVRSLSLGQKRRAELGTVFLRDPELILLDEPGIGLDQSAKAALQKLLLERKEAGATILISSHDMDEIAQLCERILLLDQGRIAFYGSREMLLKRYAPSDLCELELSRKGGCVRLPNLEGLPVEHYELERDRLTIAFNSNYISAAELLAHVMAQTEVLSVNIRKGGLLDSVRNTAKHRQEKTKEVTET